MRKQRNKLGFYFDLDGTLANLYGVDGWLEDIQNGSARPYEIAEPMVNLSALAKRIHKLQAKGYAVGIVSWLAKNSTDEYDELVTNAKMNWLAKHLPSVEFDEIHIVKYGTPKSTVTNHYGWLFDDELPNRIEWGFEVSYGVDDILNTLKIY